MIEVKGAFDTLERQGMVVGFQRILATENIAMKIFDKARKRALAISGIRLCSAILKVPQPGPGGEVLDLCRGHGGHAGRLAKEGLRVARQDPNEDYPSPRASTARS